MLYHRKAQFGRGAADGEENPEWGGPVSLPLGYFWCPVAELQLLVGGKRLASGLCPGGTRVGLSRTNVLYKLRS